MGRSNTSFGKKEKEKKRLKKRQDKAERKEERKAQAGDSSFENMLAYVDENGRITSTPPDPLKKTKIDASSIEVSIPRKGEEENEQGNLGTVKFFSEEKGYGFISRPGSTENIFVHVNILTETIQEGDSVIFEAERGEKGMVATSVKKLSS